MHEPGAGHHLEQFAGHVLRGARAGRTEGDGAGLALGQRNQFLHVVGRHLAVDGHRHGHAGGHGHAHEGGGEVVAGLVGHGRMDGVAAHGAHQQGVAVGGGFGDVLSADLAARARLVFHHHALPQEVSQVLRIDAGRGIGGAAGREGHDHADGLGRPGLGQGGAGGQRQDRARQGNAPRLLHECLLGVPDRLARGAPRPVFINPKI
ncbi:hypothetical protein D3C73_1136870 [compost metagenome]